MEKSSTYSNSTEITNSSLAKSLKNVHCVFKNCKLVLILPLRVITNELQRVQGSQNFHMTAVCTYRHYFKVATPPLALSALTDKMKV